MSWLSSVFNPASGTPSNGGQAVPTQTTQQAPAAAPALPAPPAAPAVPAEPASPLDKFTAIWHTPVNDDGTPKPARTDQLQAPLFNFDPAKITDSASKLDFTSSIDPALAQKALAGDVAALMDVINQATRNAVVGVTVSQGNLVNQAVRTNNDRIVASLPEHINKTRLLESDSDNPVFSHPAAQPLVHSLKQMFFAKDPTASPAAINKQVSDYLTGFTNALHDTSPAVTQARQTQAAGETNWMKLLA
jgi:hypothetical protein